MCLPCLKFIADYRTGFNQNRFIRMACDEVIFITGRCSDVWRVWPWTNKADFCIYLDNLDQFVQGPTINVAIDRMVLALPPLLLVLLSCVRVIVVVGDGCLERVILCETLMPVMVIILFNPDWHMLPGSSFYFKLHRNWAVCYFRGPFFLFHPKATLMQHLTCSIGECGIMKGHYTTRSTHFLI